MSIMMQKKAFEDALKITVINPNCVIADKKAKEGKDKYEMAAKYEMALEDAKDRYAIKDYRMFTSQYSFAGELYSKYNLSSFGLKYIPLYDYIIQRDNKELMVEGVNYFAHKKELLPALKLLIYLKEHSYSSDLTKESQELTGFLLYSVWKENKKGFEEIKNEYGFIFKDKWYKYLKASYRNSIKNNKTASTAVSS